VRSGFLDTFPGQQRFTGESRGLSLVIPKTLRLTGSARLSWVRLLGSAGAREGGAGDLVIEPPIVAQFPDFKAETSSLGDVKLVAIVARRKT
jgi:hypothetical protein